MHNFGGFASNSNFILKHHETTQNKIEGKRVENLKSIRKKNSGYQGGLSNIRTF